MTIRRGTRCPPLLAPSGTPSVCAIERPNEVALRRRRSETRFRRCWCERRPDRVGASFPISRIGAHATSPREGTIGIRTHCIAPTGRARERGADSRNTQPNASTSEGHLGSASRSFPASVREIAGESLRLTCPEWTNQSVTARQSASCSDPLQRCRSRRGSLLSCLHRAVDHGVQRHRGEEVRRID
jgi:hypothetical protein